MRKIPPFGKTLYESIQKGQPPANDVMLFVGEKAWTKGKNFSITFPDRVLVLPSYLCPSIYFWPVAGCDVLITDTGYCDDEYLDDLAYWLYIDGANKVRLITVDFEIVIFNK